MNINKVLVLIFCLNCLLVFPQKNEKKIKIANEKYEEFSYIEARKRYKQIIEEGYESDEIYARLGDTYFFNADYKNALVWYAKLMARGTKIEPEYVLRYSVCLRADDQHKESLFVMDKFYTELGMPEQVKKWNPDYYVAEIGSQSGRYSGVELAGVNLSGFGAVLVPNEEAFKQEAEIKKMQRAQKVKLLKISAEKRRMADEGKPAVFRKSSKKERKDTINVIKNSKLPKYKEVFYATSKDSRGSKNGWDKKPFLRLYSAQITAGGKLENEKALVGDVNTKYSESTPAITKDGLTMYFTRLVPYSAETKLNDREKKIRAGKTTGEKVKDEKNEISQLRIFEAKKKNGKWIDVKELPYPINMKGSSSAHPALSPDNDLLYFVSNRDKKINDTDLYVVKRKARGGFDIKVEDLGEEINTLGRETFPSIDANGTLYFSSDGHPGMGGLDVFAAVKDPRGRDVVVNMGEPINSKGDDFSYVVDVDSKKGFFSSNRRNGEEGDDIYKFLEVKPIVFSFKSNPEYSGVIKDSITGEPLQGAEVVIYNDANKVVSTLVTDGQGKFLVDLPALRNYSFAVSNKNYQSRKIVIPGAKSFERKEITIKLLQELVVIVDGAAVVLESKENLASVLKLKALYFDYGGYSIRKSTRIELEKVIDILNKRPSVSIEVRCYTDSRGRDDFNLKLSQNRARTIIDYIVEQGGISKERIFGDGYGESQLLNKCSNGVYCSESEHSANRRTDFVINLK